MGDLSGLVLLLLPLAAATGWFVARQSRPREEEEIKGLNPDYVRGLSHLVNNDTDEAIEIFIGLMEADEGTIDLHLALGSLFRKRGEVDRALRIHQNLVLRPQLKPAHRNQARFELARDYLGAGVLDRAEEIFLELAHQGMFLAESLKRLLRIYEREREWAKAIDTALWLGSAQGRDLGPRIAQYWCELAETAQRREDSKAREQYVKKALAADRHCVRAQLIKAQRAMAEDKPKQALKIYQDIVRFHSEFIPDVLGAWRTAFLALNDQHHWRDALLAQLQLEPHPHLQVELMRLANDGVDDEETRQRMLDDLSLHPSWLGLHAALSRPWPGLDAQARELFSSFAKVLDEPLQAAHSYLCDQCGFSSRQLNWQCPSCHEWNTTRPLPDLAYSSLASDAARRLVPSGASVVSDNGSVAGNSAI
ncbi:MAG: lipopolysaccharide assembly protein LapB [Oceanococcus sp.]